MEWCGALGRRARGCGVKRRGPSDDEEVARGQRRSLLRIGKREHRLVGKERRVERG